jgi:hypothetical protein
MSDNMEQLRVLFVAMVVILFSISSVKADFIPLKWKCTDGSKVSINHNDGQLTITFVDKRALTIPYGSAMSNHQAWNKDGHDTCGYTWPFVEGGSNGEGGWYLFLYLIDGVDPVECKKS